MSRAIFTVRDHEEFLKSQTCADFAGFVSSLVASAKSSSADTRIDDVSSAVIDALEASLGLMEMAPPVKQAGRFGNTAFRKWQEELRKRSVDIMHHLLSKLDVTSASTLASVLAAYWNESFGNAVRLDYGTGHEACFFMFLYVLSKHIPALLETQKRSLAVVAFSKYLYVAGKLQSVYRLEPAGSHGVWSLDDYHFLVFVVGASQLKQHSYITPKSARSRHLVSDHAEQYLYMRAIEKLLRTKSGLFEEHSPMLYDICGMPSWDEVCDGLIRMWEGEVLGKFPWGLTGKNYD